MLANSYLSHKSGVLVSSDFSAPVMKQFAQVVPSSEFAMVEGNKVHLIPLDQDMTQQLDLEAIIAEQGPFRKLVIGCQANNEQLRFKSDTFECYIASFSLHLVNDPYSMIREAYRVLAPGGSACFTFRGSYE